MLVVLFDGHCLCRPLNGDVFGGAGQRGDAVSLVDGEG